VCTLWCPSRKYTWSTSVLLLLLPKTQAFTRTITASVITLRRIIRKCKANDGMTEISWQIYLLEPWPAHVVSQPDELCLMFDDIRRSTSLMHDVTVRVWLWHHACQTRGVREWLSAFPFVSIPISFISIRIRMPAKHLFLFPLFSHIDIPIPSNSHFWLPYINDCVEQLMETVAALSFIRHSTVVLATQIHDTIFNTIHHCVTEDRNKSHYRHLCESRKGWAQCTKMWFNYNLRE